MTRTLLQKHASAAVKSLIERVHSLSEREHRLAKDKLRALFVTNILETFLSSQFGIGSGIILNEMGDESDPVDIIIYDNRILPPFIQQQNIGVYPAESVIATIDVKSWLRKSDLISAEEFAREIHQTIYNPVKSGCGNYRYLKPLCTVLGFYGHGMKELGNSGTGAGWLTDHVRHLYAICLIDKYTWLNHGYDQHNWTMAQRDPETNDETKQYIALLLDMIHIYAEARFNRLNYRCKNWLGNYIKDNRNKMETGDSD